MTLASALVRPGALQGVRVLNLISDLGAYGPRLLGGLGAEVIRLEPPGGAQDRTRPWALQQPREEPADAPSLHFLHYHAGQQGITLDAQTSEGRALLERLLDDVDIVLDNGELHAWGFDLDALAAKTPALVVVSLTPFGLEGERAHWQGNDLVCQAMSGMLGLFGYYDERPARFGPEQASEMGGLAAALGGLIAYFGASRGGGGEVVDIALERVCALVTFQMWNASMYHQFGFRRDRARRTDELSGGLYEAADGYFALAAWRDVPKMVELCEDAGVGDGLRELLDHLGQAEFTTRPEANAAVRRMARVWTRAELLERLQGKGMLGLPVHDVADLVADPFLQARGSFVEVEAEGLPAPLLDVGAPVRMGATPFTLGRRPPLLGEHNAEVYGRIGYDAAARAALAERGVI